MSALIGVYSQRRFPINFCTCTSSVRNRSPSTRWSTADPVGKTYKLALVSSHSFPRLIFINRYFHPDQSATSRLLSDLAFALADAGHDILILTSRQRYDDPEARLPACEVRGRVKVRRLAGTRFGRMRLLGRSID